ncbi:MAG: alpha/beta hydrolase [Actinomycetota bacterium]
MPFVSVNDIDVYFERHGAGPPVLNISGSGNDLRESPPGVIPLNRAFEVLHYDQRGLGQTSSPDGTYTMADYADDAAALISSMGWSRCHIVGTSFGGMVALNLAVRHPDLIDRLVLCCTSPGGEAPSYPLHRLARLSAEDAFAERCRLTDRRYDPDADEPIPGLGAYYARIREQSLRPPDPQRLAGLARQMGARKGHDVVADLPSIEHRTLVCAGEFDDIAPVANSELLAERMPNASLRIFDGGHMFMIQDRAAFAAITDFLQAPGAVVAAP